MRRRSLARSHRRPNEDLWTLYFALPPFGTPRHCGSKEKYKIFLLGLRWNSVHANTKQVFDEIPKELYRHAYNIPNNMQRFSRFFFLI